MNALRLWLKPQRLSAAVTITAVIVVEVLGALGQVTLTQGEQIILLLIVLLAIDALTERLTILEKIQDEIKMFGKGSLINLLEERRFLISFYEEKTAKADEIDIITLSMGAVLDHYKEADLIRWILDEGKRVRILVMAPNACPTEIRGREEDVDLAALILARLRRVRSLYEKTYQTLQDCGRCKGSFEVRLHHGIPYYAYFRADREIVFGFYFSHVKGLESECLHIRGGESQLHEKMRGHFEAMWVGQVESMSVKERTVCLISRSESHCMDAEELRAFAAGT